MGCIKPQETNDLKNKIKINFITRKCIFLFKTNFNLKQKETISLNLFFFKKKIFFLKKKIKQFFKKKSFLIKLSQRKDFKKKNFFFLNRFLIYFLEFFFKKKIYLNITKFTKIPKFNKLNKQQLFVKNLKKKLKFNKKITIILYYSLLLKDSYLFASFFKKILEKINIKKHKKILKKLFKLIKTCFYPYFNLFGIQGVFINIAGKIGVSGNAKKRRFFFFFGRHSLSTKTLKYSFTRTPI